MEKDKNEYSFGLLASTTLLAALNPTLTVSACADRAQEILKEVERRTEEKFNGKRLD